MHERRHASVHAHRVGNITAALVFHFADKERNVVIAVLSSVCPACKVFD